MTANIPYGAYLFFNNGDSVSADDVIAEWDPYNAPILSDVAGKAVFESIEKDVTYREESDNETGLNERIIIETKQKSKNPSINIVDENGELIKTYDMPVGAHLAIEDGEEINQSVDAGVLFASVTMVDDEVAVD